MEFHKPDSVSKFSFLLCRARLDYTKQSLMPVRFVLLECYIQYFDCSKYNRTVAGCSGWDCLVSSIYHKPSGSRFMIVSVALVPRQFGVRSRFFSKPGHQWLPIAAYAASPHIQLSGLSSHDVSRSENSDSNVPYNYNTTNP